MMKKVLILAAGAFLFLSVTAQAQKVQAYLSVDDLPDILKFLPPPPEEGTAAFEADKAMHDWARSLPESDRTHQAVREGTTDVDTMALYFSGAFGRTLSKETTPRTIHLLERSIRTFRLAAAKPKLAYMRVRPFVYYDEATLIPEDEDYERTIGSYPSGHTSRGWGMALVLSQLNPERQDTLLHTGYQWGQSRVIANYHWQSDLDAARLLASACFARLQACEEYRNDVAAAQAELGDTGTSDDEQLMRAWIRVVASDAFGGRKPMTPHEDLTINYLAGELEKLGLEPAFDGSWFQPFQMLSVTARLEGDKITVKGKKKAQLKYPEDLIVWTARAADKVEIPKAEFVFCGFGIHAPEFGWDDYADVDVKGKIVIAMVNDPGYYNPSLFQGRNMTYYGRWLYKFEEAIRQGAAGCLVLHNTEAASYGWHVCVNGHLEDNLALYNPETRNADELGVKGWLHEDGARKIFLAAGMDMDKALADAKKPGFRSIPLKVKGDVKMAVSYDIQETRNVGGILRGADEDSGAVVVCAHWDHLGIGTPDESGDGIYNGAADNATGVAGALLTAQKFQALAVKPRRSIVFLFPSSEESGLFGSAYYCEHPALPLEKTVACLNYESIGPAPLTRDVVILGGEHSVLAPYYVASAAAQGRYIFFDDDNSDGWFYRSDHYNFVKKGVPAVVMENGLVPADPAKPDKYPMASWYHKPCDEYREDWDLEGTLANVNLVYGVALSLAL